MFACVAWCTLIPRLRAGVAQLVEQLIRNQQVVRSIRIAGSKFLNNSLIEASILLASPSLGNTWVTRSTDSDCSTGSSRSSARREAVRERSSTLAKVRSVPRDDMPDAFSPHKTCSHVGRPWVSRRPPL